MNRISLPGNEKHKKILLIILVIISAGILIYEFINNDKNRSSNLDNKKNEQFIGVSDDSGSASYDSELSEDKSSHISEKENDMYNAAYTAFFSNDYSGSISKADELIKEFPESYMGYNIKGIAEAYNGDFNSGMSDIDKSLSINLDYGYGRFNKALTYELYGQLDNALEWYNKALEIEDYVWTYYGISSIYGRRGDVSNTVKYLKKAIDIDEAVKEEAKTEADFDPVRNSQEFNNLIK